MYLTLAWGLSAWRLSEGVMHSQGRMPPRLFFVYKTAFVFATELNVIQTQMFPHVCAVIHSHSCSEFGSAVVIKVIISES